MSVIPGISTFKKLNNREAIKLQSLLALVDMRIRTLILLVFFLGKSYKFLIQYPKRERFAMDKPIWSSKTPQVKAFV